MPIYEFECRSHGVFELERPVSQAKGAGTCPECGVASARILSVPRLAALAKDTRVALDRNARSQHEPRVICREASHHDSASAARGHAPAQRSLAAGAGRARAYTGARPWVIEHG